MEFTHRQYPHARPRRLRQSPWIRELVQEFKLHPSELIYPLFVTEGTNKRTPITSLPGQSRLTIDLLVEKVQEAYDLGIRAVALFPEVSKDKKTLKAREAYSKQNLICRAVDALKRSVPQIGIICDVALDPYTTSGHDGIVKNGDVDNELTVKALCKQALTQARAGCDIIAPSDMMDGRIKAIRTTLDQHGFENVIILSYAAKYASVFYGPFRDAIGSNKKSYTDKRSYQMDPSNGKEAMDEILMDVHEGADMIMVKPGMPYLDIIARITPHIHIPVFAYQVSGEYQMLSQLSEQNNTDPFSVFYESLIGFKRAGCQGIFTYAAIDMAKKLT